MLNCSVGQGGQNLPTEVKLVQLFLNDWLGRRGKTQLIVDGKVGPKTIGAIMEFQRFKGLFPLDGRADPNGKTIRFLIDEQSKGMAEDLSASPVIREIVDFARLDFGPSDIQGLGIGDATRVAPDDPRAAYIETLRNIIKSSG